MTSRKKGNKKERKGLLVGGTHALYFASSKIPHRGVEEMTVTLNPMTIPG